MMGLPEDFDEGLQQANLIKWALLSGLALAYLGVGALIVKWPQHLPESTAVEPMYLRYGLLAFGLMDFFMAKILVGQIMDSDSSPPGETDGEESPTDLSKPTQSLLNGSIIGMAMGEGVGFLAPLMAIYTGSFFELVLGVIFVIAFFWYFNPSRENWESKLNSTPGPAR